MEKYTVDLEKVLDEFEYNEEQIQRNSSTNISSGVYKFDYQPYKQTLKSAQNRSHYEAISVDEADFARCIKIPTLSTIGEYDNSYDFDDADSNLNTTSSSESVIIDDEKKIDSTDNDNKLVDYNRDLTTRNDEGIDTTIGHDNRISDSVDDSTFDERRGRIIVIRESKKITEFKPDLIESNYDSNQTVKIVDDITNRHLPDVTTSAKSENHSFDLIRANDLLLPSPLVKKEVDEINVDAFRFDAIDVEETELRSYLDGLEAFDDRKNGSALSNNMNNNNNNNNFEQTNEYVSIVAVDGTSDTLLNSQLVDFVRPNETVCNKNSSNSNIIIARNNFNDTPTNSTSLYNIAEINCVPYEFNNSCLNRTNSTDTVSIKDDETLSSDNYYTLTVDRECTSIDLSNYDSNNNDNNNNGQILPNDTVLHDNKDNLSSFVYENPTNDIEITTTKEIDINDDNDDDSIVNDEDDTTTDTSTFEQRTVQITDDNYRSNDEIIVTFDNQRYDRDSDSKTSSVLSLQYDDRNIVDEDRPTTATTTTSTTSINEDTIRCPLSEYDQSRSTYYGREDNYYRDRSSNEDYEDKNEQRNDNRVLGNDEIPNVEESSYVVDNSEYDFRQHSRNTVTLSNRDKESTSYTTNECESSLKCDIKDNPMTVLSDISHREQKHSTLLLDETENLSSKSDSLSVVHNNNTVDSQSLSSTVILDNKNVDRQIADSKMSRPTSLNIVPHESSDGDLSSTSAGSGSLPRLEEQQLGKQPPFWVPDSEAPMCMQCNVKFTVIKRKHHCRGCGQVLCNKCCNMKAKLQYMNYMEARVCHCCHRNLEKVEEREHMTSKMPNPSNPMEYCSTVSPLLQVGSSNHQPPPSVLVPVPSGVLKREGKTKNNDVPKKVMFSDGIRPGGDLTEPIISEPRPSSKKNNRFIKRVGTPPGNSSLSKKLLNMETKSYIPSGPEELPPVYIKEKGEFIYSELVKPIAKGDPPLKYAINCNLFVLVSKIYLDCCVNREVWCMTSEGLACVGQDEVVFIVETLPDEKYPPKDIFFVVNYIHRDVSEGSSITEMMYLPSFSNNLLQSKEHGGFIFVRPTFQCCQKLHLPNPPYLIGILTHKWETPWARLFPIRLVLRLGAEYRYYPCPLYSVRFRPALFSDVGHTIVTLLADFRKYAFTLPTVQGLLIHMEDRLTTILLPKNRYDQVSRALKNSDENVLTFAGNISPIADSHLVAIQSNDIDGSYQTQAINIHNKPRKVTGASFVVFNGSLKQCGWSGKSNIIEDGLMVQIPNDSMATLRTTLNQMKDYCIGCGPQSEEMVILKWCSDDTNFNIEVRSCIDKRPLDGVPSIRVHNGIDYPAASRFIRWTEVFIIQADDETSNKHTDAINVKKLSESIAKATCMALLPYLDLLATANLNVLAVRATIDPDNVGYEAGSGGERLPPLYMKSLDEELIKVVNEAAVSIVNVSDPVILELVFRIMEQG